MRCSGGERFRREEGGDEEEEQCVLPRMFCFDFCARAYFFFLSTYVSYGARVQARDTAELRCATTLSRDTKTVCT